MFNEHVRALVEKEDQKLREIYETVPEDYYLCVHDHEYQWFQEGFGLRLIHQQSFHPIPTPEYCEAKVSKKQYGPKV